MNTLSFRPATQSDADAVAQVYLSSQRAFVSFAAIAHFEEAVCEWIRDTLISENQVTVVEQDNGIVGMMALSTTEGTGWIDQLYLHPDAVGQGIGTKLIERAKAELGSPIRLYTFQEGAAECGYDSEGGSLALGAVREPPLQISYIRSATPPGESGGNSILRTTRIQSH